MLYIAIFILGVAIGFFLCACLKVGSDNEKKDNYYENETCSINWDYVSLSEYDKLAHSEEKKIPEKLEGYDFDDSLDANTKCERLRERMQEIENQLDEIIDYLDYLKSKGK